MKTLNYTLCAALIAASASFAAADNIAWQPSLYLAGDGYWSARIPVTVQNDGDFALSGRPVVVAIGDGPGQLSLIDVQSESIRVVDPDGVEVLYGLAGPNDKRVAGGRVPAGSSLVLPAVCEPHASARYFVYFNNPAAGLVPDFLQAKTGLVNGDVEEGTLQGPDSAPAGWYHDEPDADHRATWTTEQPQSGKRCLKTVVAEGAEPTWIATRQRGIPVTGGAKYRVKAWVRGRDVKGYAGWYLHVGNSDHSMMMAPTLSAGDGTFDWKQVTDEFTAPAEADRLDLGTVLRGTGTAWFDNISIERLEPGRIAVQAGSPEGLKLAELGKIGPWRSAPGASAGKSGTWQHRAIARLFHYADSPVDRTLVQLDGSILAARMRGRLNWKSVLVTESGRPVPYSLCGEKILLAADLPARSARTYCVYFSDDPTIDASDNSGYAQLLASQANLVKNPGFEQGEPLPEGWTHSETSQKDGVTYSVVDPEHENLGRRAVKMHIPDDAKKTWRGWRQTVKVEPGKTYLFAAWVRCQDIHEGEVRLHAHCLTADKKLCKENAFASIGPGISETTDWTFISGSLRMPSDAALLELHLTTDSTGTVWHDGVLVAEVTPADIVRLEGMPMADASKLAVWPVPAIEKVFEDTTVPTEKAPAKISVARNEREPLQLAVRSGRGVSKVQVKVLPLVGSGGARLEGVDVGVVGYVPIDHATSYYRSDAEAWVRKFPTQPPRCDGWPGMWPDPLLPLDTFELKPNVTQAVWVTVRAGKDAVPGDYSGSVQLVSAGKVLAEVPFAVHVWDFALPDTKHVAAIYDVRYGRRDDKLWPLPLDEAYPGIVELMASNRLSPDAIRPAPSISYRNGKVEADFSEFDRVAHWYFDEMGIPYSYTPHLFYLFGWAHPPKTMFGERPYPGDPPYTDADRSKLRPEFKKVYQDCLKVFWDHIKEKGWDKKFILYISDEPHYTHPEIVTQMKALCQMIHEIDPAIPIYSSTWGHLADWDDSLDIWGIGHYGRVPVDEMRQIQKSGSRLWFTTDGQMCTDTPYCAVERLLPHYCFKYGVEAYEFWGVAWLTYNPYQYGWHAYIYQSSEPGKYYWVRYPNGDGFLLYPGGAAGNLDYQGPVTSIRFEQAREGAEDYEYLYLLRSLVEKTKKSGRNVSQAEAALASASALVEIPNAGGRWSSQILPDPEAVYKIRRQLAEAIESLK